MEKDSTSLYDVRIVEDEILLLKLKSTSHDRFVYEIYLKETQQQIGYCDLRIGHTMYLYYYGNIGYRIFEDNRGHNYATKATKLILSIANKLGMSYCIITCSPDNIASVKTIEGVDGVYLETVEVPRWHPLYRSERVKMIYKVNI